MKKHLLLLLILSIPLVIMGQQKSEIFQSLNWLVGNWVGKAGDAQLSEVWEKVNNLTMIGNGAVIVKGDMVVREQLQIHLMGDHLGYIASPNNAPPTFFALIESNKSKWIFENREHNFPQRITYQRKGINAFQAKIEGINSKGEEATQEFSFHRVE